MRIKTFQLSWLALVVILACAIGDVSAQSNSKRKGNGLFNRLFEQPKKKESQSAQQVRDAVEKAKLQLNEEGEEEADAEDLVKKAAQALAENKDDLLTQGKKLLQENPDMVSEASKMAESGDLLKTAQEKAEQVVGADALKSATSVMQKQLGSPSASVEALTRAAKAQQTFAQPSTEMKPQMSHSTMTGMGKVPPPKQVKPNPMPHSAGNGASMTRITADESQFDANANVVTFEGNVELDHPEFDLTCDTLEVQMPKKEGADGAGGGNPTEEAASGGIDKAIARGYVVIEKLKPDGTLQVAIARRAVYDATTGNIVLTDFPQLQDGTNLIKGKTEATRIYLRPDSGEYDVKGPANYLLDTEGKGLDFPERN